MFHFSEVYKIIADEPSLKSWLLTLPSQLTEWENKRHGDFEKWKRVLRKLPSSTPDTIELKREVRIKDKKPLPQSQRKRIESLLRMLHPWRKGPYYVHDIHIDAEWRSDWKWDRLLPHISPLRYRNILDVGCGNGYHMWRILGEGARLCIGIDPSHLFFIQFEAIRKLMGGNQRVQLLPLGLEQLPNLTAFQTVFSMGVLCHRRSPIDHIIQLKNQLVSGGELVLETLVIPGDEKQVQVPINRYAQMRNIYFLPSVKALKVWLERVGFIDIVTADETRTSTEEQRTTDWMNHHSLREHLGQKRDGIDTVSDYPPPKRAILVARKP